MDVFRALNSVFDFGGRPRLRKPMDSGLRVRRRHAFLPELLGDALLFAAKQQSKLKQALDSLVACCVVAGFGFRFLREQNFNSNVLTTNSFDRILIRGVDNDHAKDIHHALASTFPEKRKHLEANLKSEVNRLESLRRQPRQLALLR